MTDRLFNFRGAVKDASGKTAMAMCVVGSAFDDAVKMGMANLLAAADRYGLDCPRQVVVFELNLEPKD